MSYTKATRKELKMSKNKSKKRMKLWERFFGTCIDKGARTEHEREKRRYEAHRAKSTKRAKSGTL